jgi:hypothetical protein
MPLCTRRRSTAATACCWRRTMLRLRGSDREPFFGGLHAEVLARFTDQSRLPANQDSRSEFFGPGKSFCGSLGQRKYSVRIRSPAAILWGLGPAIIRCVDCVLASGKPSKKNRTR